LFLIFFGIAALTLVATVGERSRLDESFSWLLFLCFLPLANASLDWVSVGFTRGLLHAIQSDHHHGFAAFRWALLDVLLALVFLSLVLGTTLGLILLANLVSTSLGAPPVLDLVELWVQLKAGNWQDGLWVYLLLFSTLIPTAIHFMVASLALVFWLPLTHLEKLAETMESTLTEFGGKKEGEQVVLDSDVRLMAVAYRVVTPPLALGVSGLLLLFAGATLAHYLPIWIEGVLSLFGVALAVSAA